MNNFELIFPLLSPLQQKSAEILRGKKLNDQFENLCVKNIGCSRDGPLETEMRYFRGFSNSGKTFTYQESSQFCIGFHNEHFSKFVEIIAEYGYIKSAIILSYDEWEYSISEEEYNYFSEKLFIEDGVLHEVFSVFGFCAHNR